MNGKINVLMVSGLSRREGQIAYVADLINSIRAVDREGIDIDVFVAAQGAYVLDDELDVENIYSVKPVRLVKGLLNIPKLRVLLFSYWKRKSFRVLMRKKKYDFIVFHSVQNDTDCLVMEAKCSKSKVVVFPWGSDVLRASESLKKHIQQCFAKADFIRGDNEDFIQRVLEVYPNIAPKKFVNITYASPAITYIDRFRNCSKDELITKLPLPPNHFYIVCGYSANKGQQHKKIIDQIATVKDKLPKNYLLVFPISYGKDYGISRQEIEGWCMDSQLPCCCLDKYLSDSQMACLHLITDLFIHLQVTDLANSYIMEAVYAGTKIINGSWLHYPILEEYGTPYILCDKIEDLPEKLCSVIELNNEGVIDKGLLESLSHQTWPSVARCWVDFFHNKIK